MTQNNIMEKITELYPSFTKSSKKVADYILDNSTEVQFMSITSLAEECTVAEATIFRFCKNLGLDGYNDFKLALAKSSVSNNANEYATYGKIQKDDSIMELSQKLSAVNITAIKETVELIDENSIEKAVDLFTKARNVYCFGQGGSLILAMEAWSRFATATPKFHCIEDSHLQAITASLCGNEDVILFFSYSGATKEIYDVLKPARENGAKIIVITHFSKSPASSFADIVLLCGSKETPLQGGAVPSRISMLFIIDVLFNHYCRINTQATINNTNTTTKALSNKLL